MKYSSSTAFQSYEPHQYLNLICYLIFFWQYFHFFTYRSNNNIDPRVTRGPWWPYIAHLKNIAFGQDCSAQLKYITMTKLYVVYWHYGILYYTIELYSILDHKCGLQCEKGFFGPCDLVIKQT